jgi:hypothetical protein
VGVRHAAAAGLWCGCIGARRRICGRASTRRDRFGGGRSDGPCAWLCRSNTSRAQCRSRTQNGALLSVLLIASPIRNSALDEVEQTNIDIIVDVVNPVTCPIGVIRCRSGRSSEGVSAQLRSGPMTGIEPAYSAWEVFSLCERVSDSSW